MFYTSKTTEFPDMLNCFIKKMFQSPATCSCQRVADISCRTLIFEKRRRINPLVDYFPEIGDNALQSPQGTFIVFVLFPQRTTMLSEPDAFKT